MDTQAPGEREHEGYPPGSAAPLSQAAARNQGTLFRISYTARFGEAHTAADLQRQGWRPANN